MPIYEYKCQECGHIDSIYPAPVVTEKISKKFFPPPPLLSEENLLQKGQPVVDRRSDATRPHVRMGGRAGETKG